MSKVESAISWAEAIARDDTHGYSQYYRWLPDLDCSSLVILAFQQAGIPVHENGATFTGNMYTVFCRTGFKDVTDSVDIRTGSGLKRGDVLLRDGHTAMYCGNGLEVEAAGDEYGGIGSGAQSGDQTGYEILIQYYVPNWQWVLRYQEEEDVLMVECKTIWKGCSGNDVKRMQTLLRGRNCKDEQGHVLKLDGKFGDASEFALLYFQKKMNQKAKKEVLAEDGVCGPATWKLLIYA